MKKGLNEIALIIDRSGSMYSFKNEAIEGINSFLKDQNDGSETKITIVLFNSHYEVKCNNIDIQLVSLFDKNSYQPSGMTALLDAIGRTIFDIENRLAITDEKQKPEKVIIGILTDGLENVSRQYSLKKINRMINKHKEGGWEFIFLASNQDAIKEGMKLGINQKDSVNFDYSTRGFQTAYKAMSTMTTSYKAGICFDNSDEEDEED